MSHSRIGQNRRQSTIGEDRGDCGAPGDLGCALVLLLNATVAAQEIELLVDKLEITLYDTLRLVVRVPGSNTQPKLSLPEWTVSYLGSAYRMTSINGVVEQYTEYTYQLAPKETGVFTIGPIEVVQNGRTLKSGTVVIKVVEGTVQPHPDIFLTLELPRNGSTS